MTLSQTENRDTPILRVENKKIGEYSMKRNLSDIDRIVRVVLAALFAYLYFSGVVTGTLGIVLVVLAAVFALTAVVAFCPLYLPFNFSTFKK